MIDPQTMQEALSEYEKNFGTPYVFNMCSSKTDEDILNEIAECILSDTPQKEPDYPKGVIV